ncbi:MAG: hypothetical protein Phog2KO_30620 [Phototrophicaceae bacterium]
MSAEMAQKLVQGGIKAVRSGDNALARKAFTQALKLDPNNEAAWLGMATITEGTTDKLRILNKVLEINPDNERAQEAVRRLSPDDAPSEDSAEIALDNAFVSGEIAPISVPPGDTGELSDFPIPDWSQDEDIPEDETRDQELFAETEPEPKRVSQVIVRRSADVFETLAPPPSKGSGGIPIVDADRIAETGQEVEASVQAYLEDALADYLTPDVMWERKERGRAGSGEYRNFIFQVASASLVALFIIGGALTFFILTNATAQRYLFGPSDTPMPTATFTPTATPGVTNTPSPTPLTPASETPSLDASVTPGLADPNFPPDATPVYYPVPADAIVSQALVLMQEGDLDSARDLLDEAVSNVELTGEFPPYYRLSQWFLLNDEPDEARDLLTEWQDEWQARDSSLYDRSESLFLIALARVDIYEARNGLGEQATLLNNAQNRLEASLGLAEGDDRINTPNGVNEEGYILFAESYVLEGEIDEALEILDQGLSSSFDDRNLYGNTELRMTKARILAEADRIPEALQETYFALELNPFLENALIFQTELALENGQAGLGVLYAQQYLLYYPGSLHGFYLLGQAREAENKFDLALNAYSRALAGDVTDENYTSDPFFLEILIARADLYVRQGQRQFAADDFTLALDLTNNDPAIRVRRLESSYSAGDYEQVLADIEELTGENELPQSEVLYYQGLSLIDLALQDEDGALNENYALGIEALESALARGLPIDLRPTVQEYLAIANLENRVFGDALDAINSAIDSNATAERLYLRGLILEGQGSISDALVDYEFIVTWGQYYNFPFYADALERYEDIISRLGRR